jgi:RNA polymerase sigma factor (sigma-70 family)
VKITIIQRAKHGDFYEAIKRNGWTVKETAAYLGMPYSRLLGLINLKQVPKTLTASQQAKIEHLTGKCLDELFPEEIRDRKWLLAKKKFERTIEIDPGKLITAGGGPKLIEGPLETAMKNEMLERLKTIMDTALTDRERTVTEARMEGLTLEEVGDRLNVSRERIRQIETGARNKLRRAMQRDKRQGGIEWDEL